MQSIIKISEATAIALHSIIYICNKDEGTSSVKEISQKFKVSDNHLSKVLQRLVKAGYLISSKGPKGGFVINKEHEDATFWEIYEIIEGKSQHSGCLFANGPCQGDQCIMGGLTNKITTEFENYFKKTKISDFRN